jgi:hypothetical protein
MTDNDAYVATLARLQRDLSLAEGRVEKLRAGISAIQEIIGEESRPDSYQAASTDDEPPVRRDPRLKGATMKDAALIGFERAQTPLRVRQLYDLLVKMGYDYKGGYDTFKGSMFPTLNRQPEFTRLHTGVYALSKWPNAQKAQSTDSTQGLL